MRVVYIILIIVVLLLLVLITRKVLIGGEYIKMKSGHIYSLSQLVYDNKSHTSTILDVKRELRGHHKFGKTKYITEDQWDTSYTAKIISDAFIDLLGIIEIWNYKLKDAFAVCEMESGFVYNRTNVPSFGNNIPSYFDNNGISFESPSKVYRMIDASKKIFIEFTYSRIINCEYAYDTIHQMTKILLFNSCISKSPIQIFRVEVNEDGSIASIPRAIFNDDILEITMTEKAKYNKIVIPKTDSTFGFDEYIAFETLDNELYSIQIEHSESKNSHKSNVLEFLISNTLNLDDDTVIGYISKLGFKTSNGKFICKCDAKDPKRSPIFIDRPSLLKYMDI